MIVTTPPSLLSVYISPQIMPKQWVQIASFNNTFQDPREKGEYTLAVGSMIDGQYILRMLGDGKDPAVQPLPCFADGEATVGLSGTFRVVTPISIEPSADRYGPSSGIGSGVSWRMLWALFAASIVLH